MLKVLDSLLAAGADLHSKTNDGLTAAAFCCSRGGRLNVVDLLLAKGADLHCKVDNGSASAAFCFSLGHVAVAGSCFCLKGAELSMLRVMHATDCST
jgi:ankyrin repeat protein